MDKEDRKAAITEKCDQAGCSDKHRAKHLQLFVYEQWDVHPSQEFRDWFKDAYPPDWNPVTAWNSQRSRDEFTEVKGMGWEGVT